MNTRRGFSLLELAVSLLLIGSLGAIFSSVLLAAPEQTKAAVLASETRRNGVQVIQLLRGHLRDTAPGQLAVVAMFGWPELRFRKASLDTSTGDVHFGPELKLGFANTAADPLNGVDDDGNGLSDDGVIYLIHRDGTQQIVCAQVLPGSFALTPPTAGSAIVGVRFQFARRVEAGAAYSQVPVAGVYGPQNGFVVETVDERIALRN